MRSAPTRCQSVICVLRGITSPSRSQCHDPRRSPAPPVRQRTSGSAISREPSVVVQARSATSIDRSFVRAGLGDSLPPGPARICRVKVGRAEIRRVNASVSRSRVATMQMATQDCDAKIPSLQEDMQIGHLTRGSLGPDGDGWGHTDAQQHGSGSPWLGPRVSARSGAVASALALWPVRRRNARIPRVLCVLGAPEVSATSCLLRVRSPIYVAYRAHDSIAQALVPRWVGGRDDNADGDPEFILVCNGPVALDGWGRIFRDLPAARLLAASSRAGRLCQPMIRHA